MPVDTSWMISIFMHVFVFEYFKFSKQIDGRSLIDDQIVDTEL